MYKKSKILKPNFRPNFKGKKFPFKSYNPFYNPYKPNLKKSKNFKPFQKKKSKGFWFWRTKKTMKIILRFLIRVWRLEKRFVRRRFLESYRFRKLYFRTKSFRSMIFSFIYRRKRKYRVKRLMKLFFRYFSLKGTMYKVLEKYFRDKNKIEIFFLSLRTKQKRDPLTTMILTPKLLGEFITRKLVQRHRLRDILFPIMRSLGKNEAISGFKITCSGRYTRADRAMYTWYRSGKISLNTVSRPILYDFTEKSLKFGMVSIKIWLQYKTKVIKEMKRRELLEVR